MKKTPNPKKMKVVKGPRVTENDLQHAKIRVTKDRDGSYGQGGLQKEVVDGKWFSEIYKGRGG